MPTVKGYGGGSVQQGGLAAVRSTAALSPEAAGLGMGQAIQGAGAALYRDEIERQDSVAFLEADRKLSEWENRALYDPKDGAMAKRGKDAFGVPDAINKDFDAAIESIRGGLNNDRQRVAFERSAAARRKDINSTVTRHVFAESRKFEEAETENYLENAKQAAILNSHDPERVQLEIDRQIAAVQGFAKRNGLGPEYAKQKTAQVISNTTIGVIDRMLANGQDRTAKEYFETNKANIAGDDITKVEAKLKVAVTEGEGLRGAVAIWEKLGPKNDLDPVSTDKMISEAEKQYANDPQLLKVVKQGIVERAGLHNASQRERAEGNGNAVWQSIANGANLARITRMPEFLALPGKQQNEIKTYVADRAHMLGQRGKNDGDDGLYYRLITEASNPTLAEGFAQTNLMEHRARLSSSQFNTLVGVQVAIRKGDVKETDKLLASERVQKQIIDEALVGMKLDPTPNEKTKPDQVVQINGFRRAVREATAALEARQGKNATNEQVQSIVDAMIIEGVTKKGFFFDDKRRVYQTNPGDPITIKVTDVPKADRVKIEQALKRNGRAVTNEAIVDLYQLQLARMRPAPKAP